MRWLASAIALVLTLSCGISPERIPYSDSRVQTLLRARSRVDTGTLGFTEPTAADAYRLEGKGHGYDAMLHVYGATSRTIAFKGSENAPVWIGEQESHTGPTEFETPDGKEHERIVLRSRATIT
jgi:hypothetical protein